MAKEYSPKSVREQIEDSAKDLWTSVMARDSSNNMSSNDQQDCQHHLSLESVIRVMFGPCTTGMEHPSKDAEPPTEMRDLSPRSSSNHSHKNRGKGRVSPPPDTPSPKRTESGDAAFRAIFADNHLRAEEAVSHLREQMEQQRMERATPSRPNKGKEIPGMFPASSPQRHILVPHPSKEPPKTVEQQQAALLSDNSRTEHHHLLSFDDGISVMTMHTLEEFDRLYGGEASIHRIYSDITQDPIDDVEESWKQTVAPRNGAIARSPSQRRSATISPPRFGRSNRSLATTNTKRSLGAKSMGTKSTNTTQTNEFVGVWQQEEQKYWEDVVKEQEAEGAGLGQTSPSKHPTKAQDIFRKTRQSSSDRSHQYSKRGSTITTAHSTVHSGRSSADRSLFASHRNPDGFMDVLIMPAGTEMGEI